MVAALPVAFTKVKFWRVVEPVANRLTRFRVLLNRLVNVPVVEKNEVEVELVKLALVANSDVEVAFVVVEFVAVKD